MRRWTVWMCLVLALVASGCGGIASQAHGSFGTAPPTSARLLAYKSCSQFLSQVKTEALGEVGPDGLPDPGAGFVSSSVGTALATAGTPTTSAPMAAAAGAAIGANASAGTDQAASEATPAYSTTNDQEQGVDEPDLVKTNGELLVALRESPVGLQVVSLGSPPRLRGFLALGDNGGDPTGMFLMGNDVVVLAPGSGASPTTDVTVVDLTDPDHPVVAHSFTVQGREVDARLIAGYVELVVDSTPNLAFVTPADGSAAASRGALEANRALVLDSTASDWLPSVTSEPSGSTSGPKCTSTLHPVAASGLDTVSVVPIVSTSTQPLPAVTVMGDATTVYASTSSLYVATSPWSELQRMPVVAAPNDPAPIAPSVPTPGDTTAGDTTEVHGFDLSDPAAPRYVGSGQVPGTLIGQYALSEYQGYLRVATTVGNPSPAPEDGAAPTTLSDNQVTVLQPQSGTLATMGSIDGLGSGEKIYAVRFIGSLAFVVTFRQTDPLYVVDLSAPTNPRTAGTLDLTGYSSFLQPVGNGLMLGIGQAVDQNLRVTGLQVSLFDVADPNNPTLVSKLVYPEGTSAAENDPHALLYWAPSDLAVMPLQLPGEIVPTPGTPGSPIPHNGSDTGTASTPFDGAVALSISSTGVTEAARLSHPTPATAPSSSATSGAASAGGMAGGVEAEPSIAPYFPNSGIERAVVVGSTLYTVSDSGIMANDLSGFAQVAWLPYS
ncbi:MAG: beta-propeller domain-containing protein [Acidimicrobiales bacterium]